MISAVSGKSRLDSHFAFLKMLFKMWLDFGENMMTPRDVFKALTRGPEDGTGVVANSTAVLIRPEPVKQPKSEKKCARKKFAPLFGIRAVAFAIRMQAFISLRYDISAVSVMLSFYSDSHIQQLRRSSWRILPRRASTHGTHRRCHCSIVPRRLASVPGTTFCCRKLPSEGRG